MEAKQKSQKSCALLQHSFKKSLKMFLKETGLHGLKFVGDSELNIWERSFFLIAFVAALAMTCQLISNIYAKWESTPVIIGISPHATSIRKVPFPAVTVCNMNQFQRSKVLQYKEGSAEYDAMKVLCNPRSERIYHSTEKASSDWDTTVNSSNTLKITDFVKNHSQPCHQMLRYCRFNGHVAPCGEIFRLILTDEGLCCVFNFLPAHFIYKSHQVESMSDIEAVGYQPVPWDPETGYPAKLPKHHYPIPGAGTGITMGFTLVLDAQVSEYYCSSTNGPGFKVLFHNPITTPNVKEEGLVLGIGYETNFRLAVSMSEAVPALRSISRKDRQCVFNGEKELLYHRVYTHNYCERECVAQYLYQACACIPHNYPLIYKNASVCSVKDTECIHQANQPENQQGSARCQKECLPSCIDLTYTADSLYFPLAKRNFKLANRVVSSMNKSYLLENIAVMNLYYRESAYYGSMKNVYIGFTEFLSNIGGVMGLFMGFSVISIAEMLYFLVLKPISELIAWKYGSKKLHKIERSPSKPQLKDDNLVWHTKELYPKGMSSNKMQPRSKNAKILLVKNRNKF